LFLVGFPFALFFAWAFELTPEGIRKEKDVDRSQSITPHTGHKLDRTIIVVLALHATGSRQRPSIIFSRMTNF